jgi:4'-phosphopantetheinyl transferase EntD
MSEDRLTSSGVVKARVALGPSALDDLVAAERAEAERQGLGEHRRAEWRAGRLAAHAALERLLGDAARGLVVARDPDGAPTVAVPGVLVSISHGRRWAVAAAGRVARLGIDLCELARAGNVERIARRFLHVDERALPRGEADWAALWALKEAAAKALRRGLFDGGLAASRVVALAPARFAYPALQVELEIGAEDVVATAWLAPDGPAAGAGAGSSG